MSALQDVKQRISGFPAFRSLQFRNYRLFFFGQLISLVGTWMQNVGQAWLVYQLTHSSVWLGAVGFLNSIPLLFFSMFGGTVADKTLKKKIIVATQTASMIQAFVLAALYWTHVITPAMIGFLALTLGIINSFDVPARQSFVVEMVGKENLGNAVALNSAVFNSARMFGPAIGGLIIGAFGVGWCFFLNGATFIAVIIGLLMMNVVEQGSTGRRDEPVMQAIREAITYVRGESVMIAVLTLVSVVTIFGWSYSVLLPIFADKVLAIGAVGFGNLLSANGIGALISALTVASVGHKVSPRTFLYGGIAVFVFSISIFAFSASPLLSMACLVGIGMGLIAFFATANTSLQNRVPDHLRGRVMGLYAVVFQGFFPFGSLGMGVAADWFGVRIAVAAGAGVCGVAGASVYTIMKRKREHQSKESVSTNQKVTE
ncbi:MAG: MFS transporter [Bacteroidota bacterium]|nr:MFS transporter [Bacteroidota bacterium]